MSVDIVKKFTEVFAGGDMAASAEFLADDINIETPRENFVGKATWLERAPYMHSQGPTWHEPAAGEHDKQVVQPGRQGLAGPLGFNVRRTIEFNDAGKMQSIVIVKEGMIGF